MPVVCTFAAAMLTAGCAPDAICAGGEYPVKAVGNTTGAACADEQQDPPAGYVRYPEGKVPEHVGDEWDVYWSKRVVDREGRVVSVEDQPPASPSE